MNSRKTGQALMDTCKSSLIMLLAARHVTRCSLNRTNLINASAPPTNDKWLFGCAHINCWQSDSQVSISSILGLFGLFCSSHWASHVWWDEKSNQCQQSIRELASKIRDTVEEIYNLHYLNACCGNWQNCSNTYIRWDSTIFILLPF